MTDQPAMFDSTAKVSRVTWKTILVNPWIFGALLIPADSNSTLSLIAAGFMLAVSGLMLLGVPRASVSVSIACGIVFLLGCGVAGFGLARILENLFPNFPTTRAWEWMQWVPSTFESLAALVWIFVVLNISPITRPLLISAMLVAAAAGYALISDVLLIRDALVFNTTREMADWEQGVRFLLNGCALTAWARLIIYKFAATPLERFVGRCTLLMGVVSILCGIFGILWDIFTH